jgi:hypothetical protein
VAESVCVFRVLKLADDCRDAVMARLGSSLGGLTKARRDATTQVTTLRAEAMQHDSSTAANANHNSDAWLLLHRAASGGGAVTDQSGRRIFVPLWKPPKRKRQRHRQQQVPTAGKFTMVLSSTPWTSIIKVASYL